MINLLRKSSIDPHKNQHIHEIFASMKKQSLRTAILTGLVTILLLGIYIVVQRVDFLVATIFPQFFR